MLTLILTLAVLGFIVWLIVTYIPMPAPFPQVKIIIAIATIAALLYALQGFGGLRRF